ncbi:MAG: osmotically inducible protein OsmC [Acidimicrobiales bacterium]|nr:osmotically inducible protein OsmC [Acidimicrobiales bacterium]
MAGSVHTYRSTLSWAGSTGLGYERYDRAHRVETPPAASPLELASDPAFHGDPALTNPEQLLLAAASSCQLLSFLAVAARARLDVVAYTDVAHAVMPEDDLPVRITRIELHPAVVLVDTDRPRPTLQRLAHLTEVAHRECFIANTLRADVVVTSGFSWR